MTGAFRSHLALGGSVVMANPRGGPVPPHPVGAGAIFADRENTGLTEDGAAALIAAARAQGLFAVLRANGTAEDELRLCAALRPDAVVLPQLHGPGDLRACLDHLPGDVAAIAQIETPGAVATCDALADEPGVAAFLIGPNDLAAAMSHPGEPDRSAVTAAVTDVAALLAARGRPFGLPAMTPAAMDAWRTRGARLFYTTFDALTEAMHTR